MPVSADAEFKMSIVVNQETTWGRAAERFADAIKYRTQGRVQIKNYFNGQLFAGKQTNEFALLHQGAADFAIGSVFNWVSQVKELNLFGLPFMFPSYTALDAAEAGEPGTRVFKLIEQQGAVPIAWGENGFRQVTNSKHPRAKDSRPADTDFSRYFSEPRRESGHHKFDQALIAFQQGTVDGQENPIALIVPYKLWEVHKYVTLWDYAIDPLILAVNAKTWTSLSHEDQNSVRDVGKVIMGLQKDEARAAPVRPDKIVELLQDMYGMEVVRLSRDELEAFHQRTHVVYGEWAEKIGIDLVNSVERIVQGGKY